MSHSPASVALGGVVAVAYTPVHMLGRGGHAGLQQQQESQRWLRHSVGRHQNPSSRVCDPYARWESPRELNALGLSVRLGTTGHGCAHVQGIQTRDARGPQRAEVGQHKNGKCRCTSCTRAEYEGCHSVHLAERRSLAGARVQSRSPHQPLWLTLTPWGVGLTGHSRGEFTQSAASSGQLALLACKQTPLQPVSATTC
jgi:hypothetical protein